MTWLTDKRLNDKLGECNTWDNDKEGVGLIVLDLITLEGDPSTKATMDAKA